MSNSNGGGAYWDYIYSPSQTVFLWSNVDVLRFKFMIMIFGVGELLFFIPILVLWIGRFIPSVRPLWLYCAVYYVPFIVVWLFNILVSDSRAKQLYLFGFFFNTLVLIDCTFVLGLVLYDITACSFGYFPTDCRNTYVPDIIVAVFTLILEIICIILFASYLMIISRIRQSASVIGTRLKKKRM